MTKEELAELGHTLYGWGWKQALARALDVNIRTVSRWASGCHRMPLEVQEEIRALARGNRAALDRLLKDTSGR